MELEITNHILYIKEKGQIIAQEKATEKPQSIQICFGANNLSNTSTSDVAPMIVKNIRLKTEKNKNEYYWSLKQPSQTPLLKSENGDIVAQVYNPEWVSTLHQHWKFIRGVSFSSKSFPVSDVQQGILYFVSNDRITQINLISNKMEIHKFQPPIEIERMSNQFITLPYDSVNKKIDWHITILRRRIKMYLLFSILKTIHGQNVLHVNVNQSIINTINSIPLQIHVLFNCSVMASINTPLN